MAKTKLEITIALRIAKSHPGYTEVTGDLMKAVVDTITIPVDIVEGTTILFTEQFLNAHLQRAIDRYQTNHHALHYDMLEEEENPLWWQSEKYKK